MSPIRKKTSSLPTLQIVLAIAMLLVVLVVAVYMLAPQRPMAPPPSDLEYAERPKDRVELPPTAPPDMKPPEPLAPEAVTGEEPAPETPTAEDAGFSITGLVLDSRTGDPIQDALVAVRSKSGPVEAEPREDLGERRRRLGRMRERAQRSIARAHTDEQGHFTLALVEPGDFVVEARAPEYAIATVDIGAINSGRPTADIKVELSTGGRISGRVTEEGSSLPISGLIVMGSEGRYQATTDDNGEYVLAGLPIGEHDVAVDLGNTSFKSGKTLPFQKVQITDVDQEVRNIDFTLDPAGVVWGYVVTPENDAIKSAEVVLCNSESVLSQAISSMVRQAPPLTDRSETDGYYELVGVPLNEEWRVYATSKTYSPQLADPFLLTADQRSARVDIYMFSGTTVSGRVVDSKRTPIPEADVMCMPSYSNLVKPMQSAQAFRGGTSDAQGQFTIEELPAGDYQIFARKQGYKIAVVGEPIYPDGYNNISGVELVLESVDSGDHAIFGRVTDSSGTIISGANVSLEGMGMSMGGIERQATTDGGGEFRFDGVEAGGYSLTVTKEGYAPRKAGRVALDKPTNIILDASALVRGRVLIQESNAPPAEYTVAALPLNDAGGRLNLMRFLQDRIQQTFTNPDGSFELYIPAGDYRLQASSSGYTPGAELVTLTPGQVVDDLTLFVTREGGIIAGRVETRDGNSPQGARVNLVPANSPAEALVLLAAGEEAGVKTLQVGSDGEFRFEQLPEGSYVIIAQHASYANGQSDLLVLGKNEAMENIRITLGTGGVLEGYVFKNGRIAANMMVMVLGGAETRSDTTDQTGYYSIDGLATGSYQAMVLSAGGGAIPNPLDTEGVTVDIVDGEVTRYDFGAGNGTTIEGICVPPPPPGIVSGAVVLRPPGLGPVPLGETVGFDALTQGHFRALDGSGGFQMTDVPPGEWQLDVYYLEPGGIFEVRYVHTELIVVTGEEPTMNLELAIQAY